MSSPTMHTARGGCYCGNIRLELTLTREAGHYRPRACDCGFCRKHGAAYLSDPEGSLSIRIDDPSRTTPFRQGSELAEMLLCGRCGVLIGALYRSDARIYATVNVKAVDGAAEFGSEQPVSPKQLSGDEKTVRWKKLWFSNVQIGDV